MTEALIARYSYRVDGLTGTRLDVVSNVANLVGVHWAADHLVRSCPLSIVMRN